SLATPFLDHDYYSRWLAWPGIALTAPVPIALVALAIWFARALAAKREAQPFLIALALFALTFAGLGISMYPMIVPDALTIWQAAAPAKSQLFVGVGAFVMIPVILAYSAWSYWVFRGKVGTEGYH
ncbi:MAG: cytochrome d ubiquinol oxidase subunit II, partial [Pseudomonadota bacterium]